MTRATTIVLCLFFASVSALPTVGNGPPDVIASQHDRYKITTIRPPSNVDFKLMVAAPPPGIDYKLRVVGASKDAVQIMTAPRHRVHTRVGAEFISGR